MEINAKSNVKQINVKRILIISILVPVILGAGIALYAYHPLLLMKLFHMNPTETGPIPETHIYAIRNKTNSVYFMSTNNGYIMIDTGTDAETMEAALNEADIKIEDITLLQDSQELVCGNTTVKALKAPGHTSGSMVYLINNTRYLFTGDAFEISKGKIVVHPGSMDEALAEQTIEKLKETIDESSLVLTSHYGYYENSGRTDTKLSP